MRLAAPCQGSCRAISPLVALMCAVCLAGCQSELFGKLDEPSANAVLDALYAEGIHAEKLPGEGGMWRVEVDAADHQRALHAARQQGVPQERFANMGELFKKEGLVSTPSEERLRYIFAVSQELAATLSQIDGVVSARVHPVIPANDPLATTVRPASAAVFIKHRSDADLEQMAPAIKNLVTRSIEGLAVDKVSLTFFATRAKPLVVPPAPEKTAADNAVLAIAVALAVCLALCLIGLGVMVLKKQGRAPQKKTALRAMEDAEVRPFRRA
jgi:type III secretion protein J